MSIIYQCDGCTEPVVVGTVSTRGYTIKRHYCEDCVIEVDIHMDRILAAREAAREFYADQLIAAKHGFLKAHPDGKLPDD